MTLALRGSRERNRAGCATQVKRRPLISLSLQAGRRLFWRITAGDGGFSAHAQLSRWSEAAHRFCALGGARADLRISALCAWWTPQGGSPWICGARYVDIGRGHVLCGSEGTEGSLD